MAKEQNLSDAAPALAELEQEVSKLFDALQLVINQ